MFQRLTCPRCARSIAVNRDSQMRTHFCPHRYLCEPRCCRACDAERLSTVLPSHSLLEGRPHPTAGAADSLQR